MMLHLLSMPLEELACPYGVLARDPYNLVED
jgi:hypothetical protein